MDRKTARKYIAAGTLPSAMAEPRDWRTRPDPFEEHWPEIAARLRDTPELEAKTLFELLQDQPQVDTVDIDVTTGDRFLLCSDGLHGYFTSNDEVAELCSDRSLEECAEAAIGMANQRGGKDNITALVIEVQNTE